MVVEVDRESCDYVVAAGWYRTPKVWPSGNVDTLTGPWITNKAASNVQTST
jgi:hypothetical protein